MDFTFKREDGCQRVYEAVAPWEEIASRFSEVARTLKGRVRLQGFRPGKAPESMVRSRFRREIREEVLDQLLSDTAKSMVERYGLKPVVEPYAQEVHLEEGEAFRCTLVAEEAPQVPAVEASGISIEVPRVEVSEEQVGRALESLRQRAAVMKPQEGPAEEGDFAVTILQRKGQSKGQERFFCALSKSEHPAERALVGAKPGDLLELSVPQEDYGQEKGHAHTDDHGPGYLAPGQYTLNVVRVVRREVPELGDELAKDLGAESLDALKGQVRKDMEARFALEVRSIEEERLVGELLERYPFPAPPTLVDRQLRSDLEELAEQMARQGVDLEKAEMDWEEVAKSRRPIAERKVKAYYLFEAVASAKGLTVSDEEVDAYFERKAEGTRVTAAQLKSHAAKEGQMDMVHRLILHQKALDLLLSQASVTFTEGKSATQEGLNAPDSDSRGADQPR